jgi:hypothetical protein
VIVCLVNSAVRQAALSRELADIEPLLVKIPQNARLLPLVFDSGSPDLDRRMFNLNLHAYDYYYVAVGGGYDPYVPHTSLFPVSYAPGQERPAPGEFSPQLFSWDKFGADYEYLLTRGMPSGGAGYFASGGAREIASSGKWQLFHRGE